MFKAYEEPMAFTRKPTLNLVLVLSSKYPCGLTDLIHTYEMKNNLPLTQFISSQKLNRSKVNTFHWRQMIEIE